MKFIQKKRKSLKREQGDSSPARAMQSEKKEGIW